MEVGEWKGQIDFLVVPLDDFDIILGNEFFVQAKVGPFPFLRGLLVMDKKKPCFVPSSSRMQAREKGREHLSAIRLKDGLKKGELTYLAALREVSAMVEDEPPSEVLEVLEEFRDVMPLEFQRLCPLVRRWIMKSSWC